MNRRAAPRRRRPAAAATPVEHLEPRALFAAAAVAFAPAVSLAAGTAPVAVAAADFNADGHADLAVADNTAQVVDVFYGTGTGTFTPGPVLALTAPPTAVVAADLTGDGKPDLVVAASAGNANAGPTVTSFVNAGTGTFGLGQRTTIVAGGGSNDPVAIAVADLNADGHADVVATEYSAAAVGILLGTGSGTFAPPATFNIGADPTGVAAADFDADGKPDVAVACTLTAATGTAASSASEGPAVLLLKGGGTGQFTAGSVTPLSSAGTGPLAAGDLIGDGKSDLVSGNADPTVSLLVNGGAGTFTARSQPAVAAGSTGVAIADFNLDGTADVATANGGTAFSSGADSVTVVTGAGSGTAGAATTVAVGSLPAGLAVADFNGDGRPDLATADEGGGTVSVLLNTTVVTPVATQTQLGLGTATTPAGSPLLISATITAAAVSPLTGEATPTGTVSFYDGSTLIGTAAANAATIAGPDVAVGAIATLTTTSLAVGTHRLTARYGGDGGYAAGASTALSATVTPTATSGPDLVATFATVGLPATVVPGESGTVRVTITNRGNAAATGVITNTLSLSLDGLADDGDTAVSVRGPLARHAVRLAPNQSVTLAGQFAVPADVPLGSYLLLVAVDTNAGVAQSNPTNDVAASPTAYAVADQFGTVAGRRGLSLSMADAAGTVGTFRLSGPGTGTVDTTDYGPTLTLTGTTAATTVTLATANGAAYRLYAINADAAVGNVRAAAAAVAFSVTLSGGAKTVALGDVSGAAVAAGIGVRSLSVARFATGTLAVPWVGKLKATGTFGPTVTLSGAAAPRGVALQSFAAGGDVTGPLTVTGSVGTVAVTGVLGGAVELLGTNTRLDSLRVLGGVTAPVTLDAGTIGAIYTTGPVGADAVFTALAFPARIVLGGAVVDTAKDARFRVSRVVLPLGVG